MVRCHNCSNVLVFFHWECSPDVTLLGSDILSEKCKCRWLSWDIIVIKRQRKNSTVGYHENSNVEQNTKYE